MQNKMTGLLMILNKLDGGEANLKELSADMNVTVRTLQRYIHCIEDAGFPLYSPVPGTYKFVEGYSLQKMKLSGREASLIVLLGNLVASLNNNNFVKTFEGLKNRILKPDSDNPFYVKMQEGISYESNKVTKSLEDAVALRQIINLKYHNDWADTITESKNLKPLKIANYEGFWYLIASGFGDKILKFRVSNIKDIKLTGDFFKRNKKIENILKESKNIWFEAERNITVKLLLDKEIGKYFVNKEHFPLQKTEKKNSDGTIVISCRISKIEELEPLLFKWIPYMKIIEPKELTEHIKARIANYLKTL
jgi:predicted DNA-binding transcriptional regulator YafY